MKRVKHLAMKELEAGLETIRQSPKDSGLLEMIVSRPEIDERQILRKGQLDHPAVKSIFLYHIFSYTFLTVLPTQITPG